MLAWTGGATGWVWRVLPDCELFCIAPRGSRCYTSSAADCMFTVKSMRGVEEKDRKRTRGIWRKQGVKESGKMLNARKKVRTKRKEQRRGE